MEFSTLIENNIYADLQQSDIIINFDNILNNEHNLEHLHKSGIKKVIIKNRLETFTNDIKNFLKTTDIGYIEELFKIRIVISMIDKIHLNEFKSYIKSFIKKSIPFIDNYIENHIDKIAYSPKESKRDNFNSIGFQELYFSEEHLKFLLKIILMSKICLLYIDNIKSQQNSESIILQIVNEIWNVKFREIDKTVDMKSKVHKIINSRVMATIYSDSRFWTQGQLYGITTVSHTSKLFLDFLKETILILELNSNPIFFIDVFLRSNIQWLHKKKFPFEIFLSSIESETLKIENDQFKEQHNSRSNTLILKNTIILESVKQFININFEKIIGGIDKYKLLKEKFNKNINHLFFIYPYVAKKLNINPRSLLSLDKDNYLALCVIFGEKLLEHKLLLLYNFIYSNIKQEKISHTDEIKMAKFKIVKELTTTDRYLNLIKNKFSYFENITENNDFLIHCLTLYYYNKFESMQNDLEIEVDLSVLTEEYFYFMENIL